MFNLRIRLVATVVGGLLAATLASATEFSVTTYAELKDAIQNLAQPGDVILVQPGTYTCTDDRLDIHNSGLPGNPITIRGVLDAQGNRPVITASVKLNRGVFFFWEDSHDWVVENLEYYECRGARNTANASGAYIHGDRITHRNIYAHHCDNGFFSTTDAEDTVIENSIIAYNGAIDSQMIGYTHNFYVNSPQMTVRGCYIHSSDAGQNFKSRCQSLILEYNWLENDGNYCAEIASGNENNSVWRGNVFIKRLDAGGQRRILNLSDGGISYGTLSLINNVIISGQSGDPYILIGAASQTNLELHNNIFYGPSSNVFDNAGTGTITGSDNFFETTMPQYEALPAGLIDSLIAADPGFVDFANHNFCLTDTSICIDAGLGTPTYLDETHARVDATPTYEPTDDLPIAARPDVGVLDIGAYESLAGGSGPINQPAIVDAGADQSTTLPDDTVNLDGTVSDDGLPDPPATVTVTWSTFSGPGTVTFGNVHAVDTTAMFSTDGEYVLQLLADDSEKTATDTVTITVYPEGGGGTESVAYSDIVVAGSALGTYLDTHTANDVYHSITETQTGGLKDTRISYLEYKWLVDVGSGNTSLTFYLQAYKTDVAGENDNFVFAYSTNDVDYTDMVTVTNLVDTDTYLTYTLPGSLTGTVYVRVKDTDQTPSFRQRDTVYIDHLYILGQ